MPAQRTKTRICDKPNCGKEFGSAQKLWEHKLIHLPYEQRRHACGFDGCNYRAHSSTARRDHINSVHLKIKVPCKLGCGRILSNPVAERKHRRNSHPRHDPTESYATSPSASSSSVYARQPYQQLQCEHQEAYDANHGDAARSALGKPGAPSLRHPQQIEQGICMASQTGHCLDREVEEPPPLRGQQHIVQAQGEGFSIPRSGHVPSYDKSRRIPPNHFYCPSLPPNPGMLF